MLVLDLGEFFSVSGVSWFILPVSTDAGASTRNEFVKHICDIAGQNKGHHHSLLTAAVFLESQDVLDIQDEWNNGWRFTCGAIFLGGIIKHSLS